MKIDRLIGVLSILLQEAKTEVLEPAEVRDMIRRNAKETLQLYTED